MLSMYAGMRSCNATDKRGRGEVNRTEEMEVKSAFGDYEMLVTSDLGLGNGKGNWDRDRHRELFRGECADSIDPLYTCLS